MSPTKRPDETQTEFTIRLIKAEAWQEGHEAGFYEVNPYL